MRIRIAVLAVGTAAGVGLVGAALVGALDPSRMLALGSSGLLLGALLAGFCGGALAVTLVRRRRVGAVAVLAAACGAAAVLAVGIGLATPEVLGIPRRYAVYAPGDAGPAVDPATLLRLSTAAAPALMAAATAAMVVVLLDLARRAVAGHRGPRA